VYFVTEGVLEDELQSFRRRRVEGTVTQEGGCSMSIECVLIAGCIV